MSTRKNLIPWRPLLPADLSSPTARSPWSTRRSKYFEKKAWPEVAAEAKRREPDAPRAEAPDARTPDPQASEPKARDASAPTPACPKLSLKGRGATEAG